MAHTHIIKNMVSNAKVKSISNAKCVGRGYGYCVVIHSILLIVLSASSNMVAAFPKDAAMQAQSQSLSEVLGLHAPKRACKLLGSLPM